MAALTWQQVTAPNFSGSADALRSAGSLLSGGFDNLSDAIGKYTALQQSQAGAKFLGNAAQYKDLGSLQGAMANGSLLNGVDSSYLTPDVYKALDNHATNLISNATSDEALRTSNRTEDSRVALAAGAPTAQSATTALNLATAGHTNEETQHNIATGPLRTADLASQTAARDAVTTGVAQGNAMGANNYNIDRDTNSIVETAMKGGDKQAALSIAQQQSGFSPDAKNRAIAYIQSRPDSDWSTGGGAPVPGSALQVPQASAGGFRLPVPGVPGSNPIGSAPVPAGSGSGGGAPAQSYGAALASGDPMAALKVAEGLRTTPYWDVNHYRTGYGSDTITNPDGSSQTVTKDTSITPADAERDLQRRTAEFGQSAAKAVGPAWDRLNPQSQAALTTMAYNYGHVPDDVAKAAATGDPHSISLAIASHAFDNNGVNYSRRMAESQAAIAPSGGTSRAPQSAPQAIAAAAAATPSAAAPIDTPPTAPSLVAPPPPMQTPAPAALPDFEADRAANITASAEAARLSAEMKKRAGQNQQMGIGTKVLDNSPDGGDLNRSLGELQGGATTEVKAPDGTVSKVTSPPVFSGTREQLDNAATNVQTTAKRLGVQLSPDDIKNLLTKNYKDFTPNWIQAPFTQAGPSLKSQGQLEDDIRSIGDGTGVSNALNTKAALAISSTIDNLSQQKDQAFNQYQSAYARAQNDPTFLPQVQFYRSRLQKLQSMLDDTVKSVKGQNQTDEKGNTIPNSNKYRPLTISRKDSQNASVSAAIAAAAAAQNQPGPVYDGRD